MVVYSAGVGEDISFDLAILAQYPLTTIYAFDPTPKSIGYVQRQNLPVNFRFFPYGVSDQTGEKTFFLPKNPDFVSGSIEQHADVAAERQLVVPMKSLRDIAAEHGHRYLDILKMDIEGSEFAVIESLAASGIVCGQILVEFHGRFWKNGKKRLRNAIATLNNCGYYCFAISESGDEYAFINQKEYKKRALFIRKQGAK
ncbi:MAG: FkbM family methyltransferase [Planctomycetota bacterium]|jgi:FkbM family methyltransferase|nr:FkbM family methyltransferase [Planctomycetota bacterium]